GARLRECGRQVRVKLIAWYMLLTAWRRTLPGTTAPSTPPIVDPGATCEDDLADSEGPTIISTGARIGGMESGVCNYTMQIRVLCRDGTLFDAQGCARGRCPLCGCGSGRQ